MQFSKVSLDKRPGCCYVKMTWKYFPGIEKNHYKLFEIMAGMGERVGPKGRPVPPGLPADLF